MQVDRSLFRALRSVYPRLRIPQNSSLATRMHFKTHSGCIHNMTRRQCKHVICSMPCAHAVHARTWLQMSLESAGSSMIRLGSIRSFAWRRSFRPALPFCRLSAGWPPKSSASQPDMTGAFRMGAAVAPGTWFSWSSIAGWLRFTR